MKTSVERAFSRSVLAAFAAVWFLCGSPGFAEGIGPRAGRQVREGAVEVLIADNFADIFIRGVQTR